MSLRRFRLWPPGSVPIETHASGEWLNSFERGLSAGDVLLGTGHVGELTFELSARAWIDERDALRDLIPAIGGPNVYAENWDAFRDGLADLPDGAVVIIRDIDPRHERALGALAAAFDPTTRGASDARQILALEGWRHPNVEDVTPTAWRANVYDVTHLTFTNAD